jgi:hypothetical protein
VDGRLGRLSEGMARKVSKYVFVLVSVSIRMRMKAIEKSVVRIPDRHDSRTKASKTQGHRRWQADRAVSWRFSL